MYTHIKDLSTETFLLIFLIFSLKIVLINFQLTVNSILSYLWRKNLERLLDFLIIRN